MGRFFRNDLHEEFGIWPLAYTAFGGPDVGVIAAVGAAVGDGDDGAFHDAWIAAGDRFLAEAASVRGRDSRCRLTSGRAPATPRPTIRSTDAGGSRLTARSAADRAFDAGLALLPRPSRRCVSRSRAPRCPATSCRRRARGETRPLVI